MAAVDGRAGHLRAAAVDRRDHAAQRDHQPAGRDEQEGMALPPRGDRRRHPAAHMHAGPGERTADQPGQHADQRRRQQDRVAEAGHVDAAEIDVVAQHRQRHHAGQDHRANQLARGALLHRAGHLLEREHDPAERGVERGGDAGRAAGEDQLAAQLRAVLHGKAAQRVHDAGADLHGRPFAAEHEAAGQPADDADELGDGDARGQQPADRLGRVGQHQPGLGLRNAAAFGAAAQPAHDPQHRHAAQRHHQQRCPRPTCLHRQEPRRRPVGRFGQQHGNHADQCRAHPQQQRGAGAVAEGARTREPVTGQHGVEAKKPDHSLGAVTGAAKSARPAVRGCAHART